MIISVQNHLIILQLLLVVVEVDSVEVMVAVFLLVSNMRSLAPLHLHFLLHLVILQQLVVVLTTLHYRLASKLVVSLGRQQRKMF